MRTKRNKDIMPVTVDMRIENKNGRMVFVADGLENAVKNYPIIEMTPNEQERLKQTIENNEYYQKYC